MGYDVHITRAEDWANNEGQEIAPGEWCQLIQSDPELIPAPKNGEYFVIWRGTTKYPETWFDWRNGNITTTYPDKATLRKMLQIATAFNAKIQGDEGEVYDEPVVDKFDDSYLDPNSSPDRHSLPSQSGWWASVRRWFTRT